MNLKHSSETLSKTIDEFEKILDLFRGLRSKPLGRIAIEKKLILDLEQTSRRLHQLLKKKEYSKGFDLADQEIKQLIEYVKEKRTNPLHKLSVKTKYSIELHATRERMRGYKVGADFNPPSTPHSSSKLPSKSQAYKSVAQLGKNSHLIINFDSATETYTGSMKCCFVLTLNHLERGRDLLEKILKLKGIFEIYIITHDFLLRNQLEAEVSHLKSLLDRGDIHCRVKFIAQQPSPYGWLIHSKDELSAFDVICQLHDQYPSNYLERNIGEICFHNLIGSQTVLDQILRAFEKNSQLGMVVPPPQETPQIDEPWDQYISVCRYVIGEPPKQDLQLPLAIPEHSMFWARTKSLLMEDLNGLDKVITNLNSMNWVAACMISSQSLQMRIVKLDVEFDTTQFLSEGRNIRSVVQRLTKAPSKANFNLPSGLKIAVCRCVMGNYESLLPEYHYSENVDYWLVTDNLDMPCSGPYAKILSNFQCHDPRLAARYVKMHLHQIFASYDFVVWMDASVVFTGHIEEFILRAIQGNHDIGFIYHPRRNNYVEELEENIRMGKADKPKLIAQQQAYSLIPELSDYPLLETGVMVVDLRSEKIQPFFNSWWDQTSRYTSRDQISLCYALHESNLSFFSLLPYGKNVRNASHFALASHHYSSEVLPYLLEYYRDRSSSSS